MKIVVTGSLGHISKPLTEELVNSGHQVKVISSNQTKQAAIEAVGATASIGSVRDTDFLAETFAGAEAVYTMVPPVSYLDLNINPVTYFSEIGTNYAKAIRLAGVKRVVNLSSWGAHLNKGNGGIAGSYYLEQILNALPENTNITHLRPTSFYYNLLNFIPAIKNAGIIAANYGGEDRTVLVAPADIAAVAAEELMDVGLGRRVRYVASEELTCNEVARILGEAIGKPDLKWIIVPGEEVQSRLEAVGMTRQMAQSFVELQAGHHSGIIAEDYYRNKPAMLGKVKLTDFAKDFARVYQKQ